MPGSTLEGASDSRKTNCKAEGDEMKEGLFILLGFLFVLKMAIDWIQFRDELEEMHDESEQETEK